MLRFVKLGTSLVASRWMVAMVACEVARTSTR